jgi:Cofilin/tropomyosin-type actin-binding protein
VSRRPKFIFIKYLPTTVATMRRARAGGHKGAIKQIMDAHIDIEVILMY